MNKFSSEDTFTTPFEDSPNTLEKVRMVKREDEDARRVSLTDLLNLMQDATHGNSGHSIGRSYQDASSCDGAKDRIYPVVYIGIIHLSDLSAQLSVESDYMLNWRCPRPMQCERDPSSRRLSQASSLTR